MTLNVARGLKRLGKKLQEREKRFEHEFERLSTPECAYGIRITAIPVGDDLRLQRIFQTQNRLVKEIVPPRISVMRQIPDKDHLSPVYRNKRPSSEDSWSRRGNLSFAQLELTRDTSTLPPPIDINQEDYIELHCDGLVEFGLVSVITDVKTMPMYSESRCLGACVRDLLGRHAASLCWCWASRVCRADSRARQEREGPCGDGWLPKRPRLLVS